MTLPETLPQALREMADDGIIKTHSFNCWKWHLKCAAMYAADRLEALEEEVEHLNLVMGEMQ